jgi:predicted site-specific integrase-resolvase
MNSIAQPKFVTLREWASIVFGTKPPHPNTLLNWVHAGRIQPAPKKMGRLWYVKPTAEYSGD